MDDVPSLDEIYTDRAYDTALARPNIGGKSYSMKQDLTSDLEILLQGDTRQYKDYKKPIKKKSMMP